MLNVSPWTPDQGEDRLAAFHAEHGFSDLHMHPLAIKYDREFSGSRLVKDCSFFIQEKRCDVAFVQAFCCRDEDRAYLGNPGSGVGSPLNHPLISARVAPSEKSMIGRKIRDELIRIAGATRAERILMRQAPPQAQGHEPPCFADWGWSDHPQILRVIDLNLSEEMLWRQLRKSYKSLIHRGNETYVFTALDSSSIHQSDIDAYRECHARAAGRVTRNRTTFDLMGDWIRVGLALLYTASMRGRTVQHVLVVTWRGVAYYKSAADEPEIITPVPVMHALQWRIIRDLKARGVSRYIMGEMEVPDSPFHSFSDKEKSIAFFKRGFGGRDIVLHTARYDP